MSSFGYHCSYSLMTGVRCSLTDRTRADELQENTDDAAEKGKMYHKNSMYMKLGKVRCL